MKKRLTLFTFLLFLLITGQFSATAQISEGGLPPSFEYPSLSLRQASVPYEAKIDFDVNELIREDLERETLGVPLRAAMLIPENINLLQSGEWTTLSNGQRILRYTISAPGAIATLLTYKEFYIPEGGKLFIYNADQTQVLGAYTSRTNPSGGVFSTQLLSGDEFTLEYVSPNKAEEDILIPLEYQPRIHISSIGYGYNYMETYDTRPQFRAGESGSCMVDINCEEGDNWQVQKTGVAKSLTPIGTGMYLCTGTLINNTAQDLTPYYLTAFHCFTSGNNVASADDLKMAQYYFDYEYDTCGSIAVRDDVKTLIGSEMLVSIPINGASDGALLKLDEQPNWPVYFNGWDRTNTPMTSGVGIHHPGGDVKKISTVTTAATNASWNGSDGSVGAENAHWNVLFAATKNGHSVTEGGSSGSPLFNQNGLVVGTLSGGSSSCSNPYGRNLYGKLYYHWDQAEEKMVGYLDPEGTGATTLKGTYVENGRPAANFFASRTTIYVLTSITYKDLSDKADTYEWSFVGGNITSSTEKGPHTITYNQPGKYTTTLTINKGTANQSVLTLEVNVIEKGDNPEAPVALFAIKEDIVLAEGFDERISSTNFLPEGWAIENDAASTSTNQWISANPGGSAPVFSTIDPNSRYSAMVNRDEENIVNTWLKTPTVMIPNNARMEFYAGYGSFALENGILTCYIIEDGNEPVSVWSNATEIGGSFAWNWYHQRVDLSAFAGKEVQIAWQYYGQGGNLAGLDGVQLTQAFPGEKITINVGDYIKLTDLSTGPPILYDWRFEGAVTETSTVEEPKVQYLTPGTYDITLFVKNYQGEHSYTLEDAVTVVAETPEANFEAIVERGYTLTTFGPFAPKEANVYFADKSNKYPTKWNWKFYGATPASSKKQNPGKVVYDKTGDFDFELGISNSKGSDKVEIENFAKIGYTTGDIWNLLPGEKGMTVYSYAENAYLSGTNKGDIGAMAERFDAPVELGKIESVDISISVGSISGGNDLTVKIAREAGGLPGATLVEKVLPLAAINLNGYTTVTFDEPLVINEAFYVVVDGFRQNKAVGAITTSVIRGGATPKNTAYAEYYLDVFGFFYLPLGWMPYSDIFTDVAISMNIVPKFTYVPFELDGDLSTKWKNKDSRTGRVEVHTSIPWKATASSWITIQNEEGTGDGGFTYTVQENTGSARRGLITVSLAGGLISKYVIVEQAATTPTNLTAKVMDVDGHVELNWETGLPQVEYFDDIENYVPFTLDPQSAIGWSFIDGDEGIPFKITEDPDYDYPNSEKPCAFIVYTPSETTPAASTSDSFAPHSGKNYLGCASNSAGVENNDWLISPLLEFDTEFTFSFWAKSVSGSFGLERFKVAYSTTGKAQQDFTVISEGAYVEPSTTWTNYSYTIPADAKYVAINCVSSDCFMLGVDDIYIGTGSAPDIEYNMINAPVQTKATAGSFVKKAPATSIAPTYTPEEQQMIDDIKSGKIDISKPMLLRDKDTNKVIKTTFKNLFSEETQSNLEVAVMSLPTAASIKPVEREATGVTTEIPTAELAFTDGIPTSNSIGSATGGDFEVAIKLTGLETYKYNGAKIKSVNLHLTSEPEDGITINIRRGEELIHSQKVANPTVGEVISIELDKDVEIDATQDMYIGYAFTQKLPSGDAVNYVPTVDVGPAVQGKGDLIAVPGEPFESIGAMGLNYNWLITVSVEDIPNEPTRYAIYRNGRMVGSTDKLTYTDQVLSEVNAYRVTATNLYDLESLPSKEAMVTYAVHNITLPTLDGISYNTDNRKVLRGRDYPFKVLVADDYDASEMNVTVDKGHTLVDNQNQSYVIKRVISDVTVSIDGVVATHMVTFSLDDPAIAELITTDPTPGTYKFNHGENFVLTLRMDDDVKLDEPYLVINEKDIKEATAIEKKDGATLYTFNVPVTEDMTISLYGDPVSIGQIENADNVVWTTEGHIFIEHKGNRKTENGDIRVYSMGGQTLQIAPLKAGETVCQVPAGNYIVVVDGESFKVIVK
ncbi:PKD repeat protein [Parabacteroides sp. PFB2-10]|uniref:choice-of-anchor J domain-containing protein n=1 Tax=Parabacteroides sp. PFB2-10 TaxID=1742405 RepID=UPI0024742315|nr:choice-of-anchor J domain-containing protein [Parabacteroides sp. PFB2-10]MDH6311886.1 PKD repeat protein [Parabacteroides sp. PFB2-10]